MIVTTALSSGSRDATISRPTSVDASDLSDAMLDSVTALLSAEGRKAIAPDMLAKFATAARKRMRDEKGGYRRDHLRALAQRVEVDVGEVRILGSKSNLLQALVAGAAETKPGAVPSFVPKWCAHDDEDENWVIVV